MIREKESLLYCPMHGSKKQSELVSYLLNNLIDGIIYTRKVVKEGNEEQKNNENNESESEENDTLDDMLNDNIVLEDEAELLQTSMHHYTMVKKDTVAVLIFKNHSVHRLYNLLTSAISKLDIKVDAEPISLFSLRPFLNCSYKECSLA
jgi:hypothetical protein